jgi:hypothetical protein
LEIKDLGKAQKAVSINNLINEIDSNLQILKTAPGLLIINLEDGWTKKKIENLFVSKKTDLAIRNIIIIELETQICELKKKFSSI